MESFSSANKQLWAQYTTKLERPNIMCLIQHILDYPVESFPEFLKWSFNNSWNPITLIAALHPLCIFGAKFINAEALFGEKSQMSEMDEFILAGLSKELSRVQSPFFALYSVLSNLSQDINYYAEK